MIAILKGILWVAGLGAAFTLTMNRAADRQLDATAKQCHCACAVMGDWPADFTKGDFASVLRDGETTQYAWGGGVLICLRPQEPTASARFAELRRTIEDAKRRRLERSDKSIPWGFE